MYTYSHAYHIIYTHTYIHILILINTYTNTQVHDRHLNNLRQECRKLKIDHPNMPPNPLDWLHKMRVIKRNTTRSSRSQIQHVMSAMKVGK